MGRPPRAGGDRRPCVTLFVHDLASNPIVRAAPLAWALDGEFRVEVVGLLLSGAEVYAPYRGRLPVRALRCAPSLPAILAAAPRLARLAEGDVVYACKPLFSTLLPAVLASRGRGAPLLLDVEDDELAPRPDDGARRGIAGQARRLELRLALRARAAHPLTRLARAVTVSTRGLQRRYGGTLVRHGPDAAALDPARFGPGHRADFRRRAGIPEHAPLAVFAGWPRPHKGWGTLLEALEHPAAAGWHLALAGPPCAEARDAAARLGPRFHPLGLLPNEQVPALLAAADAAPVPQRDDAYARNQLPAKALEAMAIALPVVATAVGDLPEILGGGARGWLVPPDDAGALAGALAAVAADPAGAARRGAAARAWFLREASVEAIRERIVPLVAGALAGRR